MKKIICYGLLAFIATSSFCQDTLSSKYSEVITVDSTSKDALFNRASTWIVKTFVSPKDVIQYRDQTSGKLICKGNVTYVAAAFNPGSTYTGRFTFLLTIDVKDNKYRCSFEEISHIGSGASIGSFDNDKPFGITKKAFEKLKQEGYGKVKQLAENLQIAMRSKTDEF